MRPLPIFCCSLLLVVSAVAQNVDLEARYYADAYARHYRVPAALVYAVISQESAWNPMAVSSKGAIGLMQLMPGTSRLLGVRNPRDKRENISGGVRYLRFLIDQFHGDLRLVLAAYYAGEANIAPRGLRYSNPEVIAYVEQVRRRYLDELSVHGEHR